MQFQTHLSKRDIPLVYNLPPANQPVLTVENYLKWYDLYLVHPDGRTEALGWDNALEIEFSRKFNQSAYCDHVFNPRFAEFLAEKKSYMLCDQSREILIGRWETEVKETY